MAEPKWSHPEALERRYTKALRQYARRCQRASNEMLLPEIEALVIKAGLRGDALDEESTDEGSWADDLAALLLAMLAGLRGRSRLEIFVGMAGPDSPDDVGVTEYGAEVERFNMNQWQKQIERQYGERYARSEPWMQGLMRAWELENLKLIRSIPEQYIDQLQGVVTRAISEGLSVTAVKDAVRATYDQPLNRAELIAVDQVGKLNARITRYRQEAIGIKGYIWRGVLDDRERRAHVLREKQRFLWSKPPYDGHPGEAIRCRCWAAPDWPSRDQVQLSDSPGGSMP